MSLLRKSLATAASLCLLMGISPIAQAASTAPPDVVTTATEKTSTTFAPDCLRAVQEAKQQGRDVRSTDCRQTTVSKTSEAQVVTAAEISKDAGLSPAAKVELTQAALAGTIYYKHFSWFTTGGSYTVTHNGRFYYNGWKAWVTSPYSGYVGNHSCFTNVAAILTISNEVCSDTGNDYTRNLYFQWHVTWPWGPPYFGLNYSVSHMGHVYGDGVTS